MTSLRPLDLSFAVAASARPRRGLAPPAYGGGSANALRRRGAVAATGRRHGSAASAAERLSSCCPFLLLCFREVECDSLECEGRGNLFRSDLMDAFPS
jgi:hypothetical protein